VAPSPSVLQQKHKKKAPTTNAVSSSTAAHVTGDAVAAQLTAQSQSSDPASLASKKCTGILLPLAIERPLRFVWHALWAAVALLSMWGCSRMFTYISHDLRVLPTEVTAWPQVGTQPLDFDLLRPLGGREAVPSPVALLVETLWNVLLVAQFGFCHVGFARPAVYRLCGSRYHRVLFMVVTCASYHLIMSGWRHHRDLIVWDALPLLQLCASAFGVSVSRSALLDVWIPVASFVPIVLCFSTVFKLDVWYFFGVRQVFMSDEEEKRADEEYAEEQRVRAAAAAAAAALASGSAPATPPSSLHKSDKKELKVSGMYHYVRHPMYFWLQSVVLLTPHMPFDRLVYFAATTALLAVGLPFEERKLLREFGDEYAKYMQRTPMLFPSITQLCGRRKQQADNKKTQ